MNDEQAPVVMKEIHDHTNAELAYLVRRMASSQAEQVILDEAASRLAGMKTGYPDG